MARKPVARLLPASQDGVVPKPELDNAADADVADLAGDLVSGSAGPYPMARASSATRTASTPARSGTCCGSAAIGRGSTRTRTPRRASPGPDSRSPEVVAIGPFGAHAYCLSRRLPGTTVNRIAEAVLAPVIDAVDASLRAVWAQDVSHSAGFGMFDGSGDGAFASWDDYLLDPAPVRAATGRPGVPPGLAEGLRGYVADRAVDCPANRSLLHGDFGSDNVLTDGGAVTGVLDWELAGYGDWLHDVAEILQWEGGEACMTAQARQLRRTLPRDPGT